MLSDRPSYVGGLQRSSTEDGPGIRTTVFFKGCPLNCKWCHNPELISYDYQIIYNKEKCIGCGQCVRTCPQKAISFQRGEAVFDMEKCSHCGTCVKECCTEAMYTKSKEYTARELLEEVLKDKSFYDRSGGGVTLSGGEVITHFPLAYETAKLCHEYGIKVALDTCGYGDYKALYQLACVSDIILFDLKHMDRTIHKELTGRDPMLIWSNLEGLCDHEEIRDKIIIRVPFIHPLNDSKENLSALRDLMEEYGLTEVNFLPYHNMGMSKARQIHVVQEQYEEPSDETLLFAKEFFEEKGIKVVLMGKEE